MFWEFYQQRMIHNADARAGRAEVRAENVGRTLDRLEDKVDALALTCQALWELLEERTNLTENELMAKMNEIDLRDGRADGRMGTGGQACPKCGRTLSRRRHTCMYCGEAVGKDHLFQH